MLTAKQEAKLAERRKLTEDEKSLIHKAAYEEIRAKNPDAVINIRVGDEIDENGNVNWVSNVSTIKVMPPGWKPR